MTRVLFLVCHLTGSGHLARTLALAGAVAGRGGEALVVSGGRSLPHLDARGVAVEQLPPLAVADLDYATLRDAEGRPADAAYLARRRAAILAAIRDFRPDRLVVETFPFGRRALGEEFALALDRAEAPGFVSVRDVPEPPRKPRRAEEAEARLARWDLRVLVHGDPRLAPFALGWPEAERIADRLLHTGYVADPMPPPEGDPEEALVAVGGGALGRDLLRAAVAAARLGKRPWRLRVGGADAEALAAALRREAGAAPVTVEPAAEDYRARLGAAAASVSLFGYNTAVDLLQARTPAVVHPMAEGGEREQTLRARAFARLPQFEALNAPPAPEALRAAVERAVARGRGPAARVDLSGAATTAAILLDG